jgi:hypothetical protein
MYAHTPYKLLKVFTRFLQVLQVFTRFLQVLQVYKNFTSFYEISVPSYDVIWEQAFATSRYLCTYASQADINYICNS